MAAEPSNSIQFPCGKCGAPAMAYDADKGALCCPFCGHVTPIERGAGQQHMAEHPLASGLAQDERLLEASAADRTRECGTCGAVLRYSGVEVSSRCDFCGSQQMLNPAASTRRLRPQGLLPFAVSHARAKQAFAGWLGGLWFRPSALSKLAKVEGVHGVYVPYWTFDAQVDSRWQAEAGYHYMESETYFTEENGRRVQRTRMVQRTRWQPAAGERSDLYDDALVVASRGLPTDLAERLRTFSTSDLVPYDPRYIAGFSAEEYGVPLAQAWEVGEAHLRASAESRCAGDVPGDTHRFLQVDSHVYNVTFKHVLLPLWIASYRYHDEVYRFLVNGQTGEVTGKAPWSVIKIVLAVLVVLVGLAGLALSLQR